MSPDFIPNRENCCVVRDAEVSDVPQILSLIQELARYHGDTPAVSEDIVRREGFGSLRWIWFLVAEAEGRLLGYAALLPVSQLEMGVRGMDMHHLCVTADARGSGTGTVLVEAACQKARALDCSYLMVGTHPDNQKAQAFYLARGFERRPSSPFRFIRKSL